MENYTFVELGGEKYPIKFGFNALRKYSNKTGTTLAQLNNIGENMSLDGALVLIHCGIEDGYRAAKQPFTHSIDDITDMFDGHMDCMEKAFEILARAMGDGNEKKVKAKRVKKS